MALPRGALSFSAVERLKLGLPEARRIALAAQGFHLPRPARPGVAQIRETIRRLGLIQLDYVNVVGPAHYHVLFSRLGTYPRGLLDELVYRRREFLEHWAHEASIVPVETYPLLAYRRQTHRARPYGFDAFLEKHEDYCRQVLEIVRERGPLTPADLPDPPQGGRRLDHSWFGTVPRAVLEAYFGRGRLAIAGRLAGFTRVYDLAERVVAKGHLNRQVGELEAKRLLVEQAAKAHGVATAGDLADYFRMTAADVRVAVAHLVQQAVLQPVQVEGWRDAAYIHASAKIPTSIGASALLSPFDPLIWTRRRTLRLFGFDYRFEIFVPEEQRRWGAYVLPFLHGEHLAARVDCKAEREAGCLTVRGAWIEQGRDLERTAGALAAELRLLASWLGLTRVRFTTRSALARGLRKAMA